MGRCLVEIPISTCPCQKPSGRRKKHALQEEMEEEEEAFQEGGKPDYQDAETFSFASNITATVVGVRGDFRGHYFEPGRS